MTTLQHWLARLYDLEYPVSTGSINLYKDTVQTVDALLMRQGREVAEHDCPYPVSVSVAEGKVSITVASSESTLGPGERLNIPPGTLRSLRALSDTKMIIQLLKQ